MNLSILLGFLNLGGPEAIVIIVGLLLIFGGKKIPDLARGLGQGIREFKDASKGTTTTTKDEATATEEKKK